MRHPDLFAVADPLHHARRRPTVAWRICDPQQADLCDDETCRSVGRWNSGRRPILYLSDTPALALLELRVHLETTPDELPEDFVLLSLPIPERTSVEHVPDLPDDPRAFGDRWLDERRTAILVVPSVIVPVNANVLVNPEHPDVPPLDRVHRRPVKLDRRLWAPFQTQP